MRTHWTTELGRTATLGALAVAATAVLAASDSGRPKYYPDDPILVDPETQDAAGVRPWKIDLFYDLMLNSFARPGLPPGDRARNVNTIDEIPDSSWFTNRILAKPLSIEELVRGPATGGGPVPGQLTIIRPKVEGDTPGFTVRDAAGATWFISFDPKSNPEAGTGAAVIANRIFWALGYNQAEYHIVKLSREQLLVDKEAKFTPRSGKSRPMTMRDLDPIFEKAARNADGTYRAVASRLLPGKILGGFKYHGTRSDDPNDIVPHELRRELRALHVFGAWTNVVDIKALNTMDTLIVENGRSRVRHYLLDVGSGFGIGANGAKDWTDGYEYFYEPDHTLKRMYTLGFHLQPWQTVPYADNKSIGRFEGDEFDPLAWKSRVPAAALLHARDDDNFWAARRVMAFTDEIIRALVKVGQYSDPAAEKLLADVLIKRRDKIGRVYFARINPLVNFSLEPAGTLRFQNAAVYTGVTRAELQYTSSWAILDNQTGARSPLGDSRGGASGIAAPSALPARTGSYIAVDLRVVDPPYPAWANPVRVTFERTESGWKLVGVDRMLSSAET